MGLETAAIVAAASGAASLAGSAISSATSSKNNQRSLQFSEAENEKSRQWQEAMYNQSVIDARQDAQQQQNWTQSNMSLQSGLQRQMMDYIYSRYQSPEAQAKAFRAIGINPAAALSNLQSGMSAPSLGGAPAGASSRGGSSPSVSMMSPPHLENEGAPFQMMVPQIASAVESLANANVNNQQQKNLAETLPHIINKMVAETDGAKLANSYQEMINKNYEIFGEKEWVSKLNSSAAMAYYYNSLGDETKSKQELNKIQKLILEHDEEFQRPKAAIAVQYWTEFLNNLKESNNLMRQQAITQSSVRAANYASAAESSANAENTSYELAFKRATEVGRLSMFQDELTNSFNSTFVSEANKQSALAAAEQARYAADNKEALFWKDYILDCLDGLVSVGSKAFAAKSGARSAKAFESMSESQKRKINAQINQMEVNSGDVATRSYKRGKETITVTHKSRKRKYD